MPDCTVMTWNVESFFRPAAHASQAEKDQYHAKVTLLAGVIERLGPDVIGLQELGGDGPLQDLQQALHDGYPHRAVSRFDDHRHIRVGLLSRFALEDVQQVVDFPAGPALQIQSVTDTGAGEPVTRMGRGALQAVVRLDGAAFTIVTAHLKSKLLSFPRPHGRTAFQPRDETERVQVAGAALHLRTAEAVTLRTQANALLAEAQRLPLVVLGDFNDEPSAQTSLVLCGPPGSEIGTAGFARPDEGDAMRLFNLAPAISPERRYSRKYLGRPEMIDQVFVSDEFFPVDSANHRHPPLAGDVDSHIDFVAGSVPSVSDDPSARAAAIAPDHAPVTARLRL
jgi:endonuclease/exonuclease/phosphatase family metal-dependent hydrolase